ncbi:MAG: FHA domain-containing protein [Bdellovibrionaceae bacterium]|jgi:pSer/pThr/pTyr-binding forkhead associated (FHA) protein|nr:FHA domain-containing protein [Pseudobdellovibrionaceae bacterium]
MSDSIVQILISIDGKEEVRQFSKSTILIGRDPSNDFPTDMKGLSRKHLQIKIKENKIYIVDLGSTFGTGLRGVKIPTNHDIEYRSGEPILIGKTGDFINVKLIQKLLQPEIPKDLPAREITGITMTDHNVDLQIENVPSDNEHNATSNDSSSSNVHSLSKRREAYSTREASQVRRSPSSENPYAYKMKPQNNGTAIAEKLDAIQEVLSPVVNSAIGKIQGKIQEYKDDKEIQDFLVQKSVEEKEYLELVLKKEVVEIEIDDLVMKRSEIITDFKFIANEIKSQREHIGNLEELNNKLNKKNTASESSLKQVQQDLITIGNNYQEKKNELDNVTEQLSYFENKIGKDKEAKEAEYKLLKNQVNELEKTLGENKKLLLSEVQKLVNDKAINASELTRLKDEISATEDHIWRLKENKNTLNSEIDEARTHKDEAVSALNELQSSLVDYRKNYDDELSILKGKVKEKDIELSNIERSLKTVTSTLSNEKSELIYEINELQAVKKDHEQQIKQKAVQMEVEQIKYNDLENDLKDKIWKLEQNRDDHKISLRKQKDIQDKLKLEIDKQKENIDKLKLLESELELKVELLHKSKDNLNGQLDTIKAEESKCYDSKEKLSKDILVLNKDVMQGLEEKKSLEERQKKLEDEYVIERIEFEKCKVDVIDTQNIINKLNEEKEVVLTNKIKLEENNIKVLNELNDNELNIKSSHKLLNSLKDDISRRNSELNNLDNEYENICLKIDEGQVGLKSVSEKIISSEKLIEVQMNDVAELNAQFLEIDAAREASEKTVASLEIKIKKKQHKYLNIRKSFFKKLKKVKLKTQLEIKENKTREYNRIVDEANVQAKAILQQTDEECKLKRISLKQEFVSKEQLLNEKNKETNEHLENKYSELSLNLQKSIADSKRQMDAKHQELESQLKIKFELKEQNLVTQFENKVEQQNSEYILLMKEANQQAADLIGKTNEDTARLKEKAFDEAQTHLKEQINERELVLENLVKQNEELEIENKNLLEDVQKEVQQSKVSAEIYAEKLIADAQKEAQKSRDSIDAEIAELRKNSELALSERTLIETKKLENVLSDIQVKHDKEKKFIVESVLRNIDVQMALPGYSPGNLRDTVEAVLTSELLNEETEYKQNIMFSSDELTQKKEKEYLLRVVIKYAVLAAVIIFIFINISKIEYYFSEIKQKLIADNKVDREKLKVNIKKQVNDLYFKPLKTKGLKAGYLENVLYTEGYIETYFDPEVQNKWVSQVSNLFVDSLSLDDDLVIDVISSESVFIKNTLKSSNKLLKKSKLKMINSLREKEDIFNNKIKQQLRKKSNYKKFIKLRHDFMTSELIKYGDEKNENN